jgi:hypothetical protein
MRWYDYIMIFLIADMSSAFIVAIMMGAVELVFILPLFVIAWMSYEDFRVVQENDKERK